MQIDWWTLALQTINFLIVVWLLGRFLYQPIKRVIAEREAADHKAAEMADEKVKAAEAARASFESRQAELAETQRQNEARLHAEMETERRVMLDAAEKEAAKILADAKDRLDRERKQALDDLSAQIADLAGDLARKALEDGALTGDALRQSVLDHLDASPADLADLRTDLSGHALTIATAAALPETDQRDWRDALAQRFDGATITFQTDPALLGGAELRFPHAVLSFSVADRLRQAANALKAG